MFDISTEETYRDGQVIFEEGASGDWVYLIDAGQVELVKNVDGRPVVVETLQPGDVFGEMAFVAKMRRSVTARAKGETCLGIIDREMLDTEFNKLSGGFRIILQRLAMRLRMTTEVAARSGARRSEAREPVVLAVSFKHRNQLINAFTEDICGGGMFVRTPRPLAEGERFFLKMKLPGHAEALRIGCEVAWQRTGDDPAAKPPPGMGIRFVQIRHADHQRIRSAIQEALQG